jgi:hypothetical protein
LEDADNKKQLFDVPVQIISELLDGELSPESSARCAFELGNLSVWWTNEFLKALWEGAECADWYGALMLDYQFWKLKILSEHFEALLAKDPNAKSPVTYFEVCPLMGLLLSCGRVDQAKWIARKLLSSSTNPSTREWLLDRDYSRYMLNISQILATDEGDGSDNDVQIYDCGVYNGLFVDWTDENALQPIIVSVFDEYVARTDENNEGKLGRLEFVSRPYNVLPVTVLAYLVLRRELGLMTDLPQHQILASTFLCSFPESMPSIPDDVLSKVVTTAANVFPKILSDA